MNIKEYIASRYRENPKLSGYDLSEGSNIYDLVLEPLSYFFEDALGSDEISLAAEERSWASLGEMSAEELRNKAKMCHIEPTIKASATTLITLHFLTPVDWDIPEGSKLSYGQAAYQTAESVPIREKVLLANQDSQTGLYVYSGIRVFNEDGINIPANTLGYMDGAPAELVKITHPATTNGVYDDDKASLIGKIKKKALAMTGGGVNGITSIINTFYPGVDVCVVTPGDDRMQRDMMYNVVPGDAMPIMESSYRGKIKGTTTYNRSVAYMLIQGEDDLPSPYVGDPTNEFSQGHYLSVVEDADGSAIMSTGNVMCETFTQSSEKIGVTSALDAEIVAPTREITVANGLLYAPGDMINIVDRSGAEPTQSGVVESVDGNDLTLYNNLTISISDTNDIFVDIVNAEGLYIGPGWIKSEHDMPMGVIINENEARVVDNELVLGLKFEGDAPNMMKQVFLRYGVRKMIENMVKHVSIESIWGGDHMEEIYTETTDNMR